MNQLAEHKYLTGVFDQISQANTKPYVQEIFELCGFDFRGEEYVFDTHDDKGYDWSASCPPPIPASASTPAAATGGPPASGAPKSGLR